MYNLITPQVKRVRLQITKLNKMPVVKQKKLKIYGLNLLILNKNIFLLSNKFLN